MALSFRTARNLGLIFLLTIILLESVIAYVMISKSSERLSSIIKVDEVKLRSWYDVSEIISVTKDSLYDYRLGRTDVIAATDLLINRVIKEVESIRSLATDQDELNSIDEIIKTAKMLKQAVYAYEVEMREGYSGGASTKEMEEITVMTADRIDQLGRSAAAFVSNKIEEKNQAILHISDVSRNMLRLALFIAVIATLLVAFFMAQALARPMAKLIDGTVRLAAGDLEHRVEVNSSDEIGILANSFNNMAKQLMHSREELLTAKSYTDNIIRSMTNALVVVNRDETIRNANQATFKLLGFSQKELLGQPFSMIFAEGYYDDIALDELISSGSTRNLETTYLAKDGRKIRILFTGSPIFDTKGNFEGFVCVGQDITIQTEAMRAGHLASIGELAAGVAHEINNPINSIINFAQILADDMDKGDIPDIETINMIIKEGDRVATIVKSLLSFARESETTKTLVKLHEVLQEVLALTDAQIIKDGIHLRIDMSEELPLVLANFQQLEQVVLNIINNARYALNKRYPGIHPDKYLIISGSEIIHEEQRTVELVFYDQGTGIAPHIIAKILNPFFSTKPAGSGTGLGLAISHGIISDHGGKIHIESNEGEFTKVTLLLPAWEGIVPSA